MSWLDSLKNGGDTSDDKPAAGNHTAVLARAQILETRNGPRIKLEWQTTDPPRYWDSWHGVEGGQRPFARALLKRLGIDLEEIDTQEELEDALAAREGATFLVNVTHKPNGYFDTTILETVSGGQTAIPVETPPAKKADGDLFADDIPF